MNRIVAAIVVAVVLAAPVPLVAQDGAPIDRGMEVYAEQRCSLCHAVGGEGNANGALDGVGSRLTPDELRDWLLIPAEMTKRTNAERKPPMRAFSNLPEEDLDALVAYLVSLSEN